MLGSSSHEEASVAAKGPLRPGEVTMLGQMHTHTQAPLMSVSTRGICR